MVIRRTFGEDAGRGGVDPVLHAASVRHTGLISHSRRRAKIIAQTLLQPGAETAGTFNFARSRSV